MRDVVIVDACRTAVGTIGGTLKAVEPVELARTVVQGILDRTGIDPAKIDEVILGHCVIGTWTCLNTAIKGFS